MGNKPKGASGFIDYPELSVEEIKGIFAVPQVAAQFIKAFMEVWN